MRVSTGSQEDADDFSMTKNDGPAQGCVMINMDVGTSLQRRLDTIDSFVRADSISASSGVGMRSLWQQRLETPISRGARCGQRQALNGEWQAAFWRRCRWRATGSIRLDAKWLVARHAFGMAIGSGPAQGCVIIGMDVGASSQEGPDDVGVAIARGPAQRLIIFGMNIGTGSQQPADDFDMATVGGPAQGPVIIGMNVGASRQQPADDFGMTLVGGQAQGFVIIGMDVDVGSQQQADHFGMAIGGGPTQECVTVDMNVGTGSRLTISSWP